MKKYLALLGMLASFSANATLVSITDCGLNAISCDIIVPVSGSTIMADPNDDKLLAWDEVQNHTLTQALYVDRVFDETASFVSTSGSGFLIEAGTVVSSHYVQWDPNGQGSVTASINTDSNIFAFITSDSSLANSDFLGLPTLDYGDFNLRGLESGDGIFFNGNSVNIRWSANRPGDWARMVTAFSPSAPSAVPVPAALFMFAPALLGFMGLRRKAKATTA